MKHKIFQLCTLSYMLLGIFVCHAQKSYSDTHPVWSPKGDQIAFTSDRDGNIEIYVTGADGQGLTRLTNHDQVDAELSWSPDGSMIAFNAREKEDGDFEIFVINADGTDRRQLTFNQSGDYTPSWTPDGQQLIFSSNRDYPGATDMEGNRELYVMDLDGNLLKKLTNFGAKTSTPQISPKGQKIAFTSDMDGDYEIYTMKWDGTKLRQMTFNDVFDWYPIWDKKGKHLWYTSGNWDPYIWSLKKVSKRGKTSDFLKGSDSGNATWSPDFSKICYTKVIAGLSQLYIYDPATKIEVQLTTH